MEPAQEIDQDLLRGFVDEALESLDSLDRLFVELEQTGSPEVIQAIFRPIHSIKGNASFFDLVVVRGLAHDLEQVLDQARRGQLTIGRPASDLLLEGVDTLKSLLRRLVATPNTDVDQTAIERLRSNLRATASTPVPPPATALAVTPSRRHPAAAALDHLDQGQGLVLAELDRLASWAHGDAARAAVASFRCDLEAILAAVGWSEVIIDLLREQLPRIQNEFTWQDPEAAPAISTHPPSPPPPSALQAPGIPTTEAHRRTQDTTSRTRTPTSDRLEKSDEQAIRVPTAQIDGFLGEVGELLVLGDLLAHVELRLAHLPGSEALARDLRQALVIYQQVATNLRESVMGLRQVPAKRLLQKVPRLVRDVAAARGKRITAVLAGEDLGLDKAVLELLDAPIIHLVRNAADHGIEMPEVRTARGKTAQGTIRVTIAETDTAMCLTVADDGGGLDLDRIRAKAVEAGLVAPGAPLARDDIVNFIFASGVSTATEVSDISGRGVGLDVVRRAIESVGGRIDIDTQAGQGSTFTIQVPKGARTQILAGFVVGVGPRSYILPLDRVIRAVALTDQHHQRIPGHGERLLLDHETYSHHHLGTLTGDPAVGTGRIAVLLRVGRGMRSLGVDEVLGVRQVLVRPIEGRRCGPMITGGAVMGDGTVAVVLNPDELPT